MIETFNESELDKMEKQIFVNDIKRKFSERQLSIEQFINDEGLLQKLLLLYNKFFECFDRGNKLMFCGNGGSAADCQHIVAEFIVKLSKLRKALSAISLTSNNSIITAISNDNDYNTIFTRQLEGIAKSQDILIGISTSGNSQNIIDSFEYAKQNDIYTVSVTGDNKNRLLRLADISIIIPSQNTQIIQEIYLMIFHIICEKLDEIYE